VRLALPFQGTDRISESRPLPIIGFAPRKVARARNAWKARTPPSDKKCQTRLSPAVTSWRFPAQTDEHRRTLELFGAKRQIVLRKRQEKTRGVQNAPEKISPEQNASFGVNSDHGEYRSRCGIVRHRRCLNPRVPRSTPSAYSQRGLLLEQGHNRAKGAARNDGRSRCRGRVSSVAA